eukprot:6736816-Pyramimonas_sp.AAC.1
MRFSHWSPPCAEDAALAIGRFRDSSAHVARWNAFPSRLLLSGRTNHSGTFHPFATVSSSGPPGLAGGPEVDIGSDLQEVIASCPLDQMAPRVMLRNEFHASPTRVVHMPFHCLQKLPQ